MLLLLLLLIEFSSSYHHPSQYQVLASGFKMVDIPGKSASYELGVEQVEPVDPVPR